MGDKTRKFIDKIQKLGDKTRKCSDKIRKLNDSKFDNAFMTNTLPLPLRFRAKKHPTASHVALTLPRKRPTENDTLNFINTIIFQ
ncbi:hypothetical protein [Lysinibacillus sp. NPDC056232]|uniref:hypothetical protein n=1 Tax=Lysinibacillus sp. NPDC056232 TaxID=3345756 RepID=UPI0035D97E29